MKRLPKTYKQSAVNAVILVLVLILFVYMGAQLFGNFSNKLSTQRTQEITDVEYLHLRGYVFRYETPVYSPSDGVCDYLLDDGARVGVDKAYATFYPIANGEEKQERLDELSEQIRRLSSKGATGGTVSDLSAIIGALDSSYYSFIDNVQKGDVASADRRGNALVDAIVNYRSVTTGWGDVESGVLNALKNEKKAMLESFGAGQSLVAQESFYFFHDTDGYENVFSPERLEGISCEELDKLISAKPESYNAGAIGKRVDSAKWFLVVPTDEETVMRFSYTIVHEPEIETGTETGTEEESTVYVPSEPEIEIGYHVGKTYSVTYSSGGDKSAQMVLDSVKVDENGKGYLIFSSYDLTLSAELSRAQDVKVEMNSETGYRIPTDALVEVDGEIGVYIIVGTVVEFRRVTVSLEDSGNGYVIVKTYEMDRAELDAAENEGEMVDRPAYLKTNDLIITSGNDLYDGKLID